MASQLCCFRDTRSGYVPFSLATFDKRHLKAKLGPGCKWHVTKKGVAKGGQTQQVQREDAGGGGQLCQPQAGRVPKDRPDPNQSLCQVEQVPIWVQV